MKINKLIISIFIVLILIFIVSLGIKYYSVSKDREIVDKGCGYKLFYYENENYPHVGELGLECNKITIRFDKKTFLTPLSPYVQGLFTIHTYNNVEMLSKQRWIYNEIQKDESLLDYGKVKRREINGKVVILFEYYRRLPDEIDSIYYFIFSNSDNRVFEITCRGGTERKRVVPICEKMINSFEIFDRNPNSKMDTKEVIQEDIEICANLDDDKDSCIRRIAIDKADISICKSIETDWIKDDCIKEIAIRSFDIATCELIENKKPSSYDHYLQCKSGIEGKTEGREIFLVEEKTIR